MSDLLIATTYGPVIGFIDTFPLRDKSAINEACCGSSGGQSPVLKWLGIPYAQAERWQRPRPPKIWSEPLKCQEFGPCFPQASDLTHLIYGGKKGFFIRTDIVQCEEKGFNLNVFRPSTTQLEQNLPVMVWIHGGSLESGSSASMLYDPTEWIRRHDQVGQKFIVVTGNYRLNLFGFLAGEDLAQEDEEGLAGNYGGDVAFNPGAYDCIKLLEWVQANIENFGGDPQNVTLFGESAGGFLIGALLVTQGNLFQRAIMQSGFPECMKHRAIDSDSGDSVYRDLLDTFSISAALSSSEKLHLLRKIPQAALVEFLFTRGNRVHDYGLTIENPSCPSSIWSKPVIDSIRDGRWNPHLQAVLLGDTTHEGSLFAFMFNTATPMGFEFVRSHLCPSIARSTIDELYPTEEKNVCINDDASIRETHMECTQVDWKTCASSQLISDLTFKIPLESLAIVLEKTTNQETKQLCSVFRYKVDATLPTIDDGRGWGAFHTIDIPFIFNLKVMWEPGSTSEIVSQKMGHCWAAFARSGSPAPEWPQYVPSTSALAYTFTDSGDCLVEDLTRTRSDLETRRLEFWIGAFQDHAV